MSKYFRTVVLAGFLVVLGLAACEDATDPDEHPLVGTWDLTGMEQYLHLETALDYTQALGLPAGYVLADTTITWQAFQGLGVEMTVDLNNDNTYSMSGNLPVTGDTLGTQPYVVQLTDQGEWSAGANLDSFTLDGFLYTLFGDLTVDDQEDPSEITLSYTEVSLDTVIYMVDTNQDQKPDMPAELVIDDSSRTTLEFTRR